MSKYREQLERKIVTSKLTDKILTGTVLAIDPSSGGRGSNPGWAVFKQGTLSESGIIELDDKMKIEDRLSLLYDELKKRTPKSDVLAIEKIRGRMAHEYLKWAVGVSISASDGKLVEVPIPVWKGYAKQCEGYEKSDEKDAIIIGMSLVEIARDLKE